jgi:predicted  nucleic acid-binding Zn-ribbon protein
VNAAAELLETEERDERRLEGEMRDQEALEERLNAQSGQIQSAQAYEALQHEIQHASEAGSSFETQALEHMEAIDEGKARLGEAKQLLAERGKSESGQREEIAREEAELSSERSRLLDDRARDCAGIEPKVLAAYDRVADIRHPAVVALTEKSCPGCRIAVPPQRVREIAQADAVHTCANCQRLLISPRALADSD